MSKQIPPTQHAVQFVGVKEAIVNPAKPMYEVGPKQILVEVEACGICFSDIKLINAFDHHPRKSEVVAGLTDAELAEIPSYQPGSLPVVPGHEPVGTVVRVGEQVTDVKEGDRFLIQTDYRHLPTVASNAAFGYNFDGALQQYVVMDERVITDPVTGESFLIPVSDAPSASAVALIEPWACVQAAYHWTERQQLKAGGQLLLVVGAGRQVDGVEELVADSAPGAVTAVGADYPGATTAASLEELGEQKFDDIIYFGANPDVIEQLETMLPAKGILNVVLGGERISRPTKVDVGRIHYDLIRYTGTRGNSAADGYRRIPATPQIRPGNKVAIVGAAGPMGLMHSMLTVVSGVPGITMDAVDVDDARLARLEEVVAPAAIKHQVPATFRNSKEQPLDPGYDYVAVMVPAPFLVAQAVEIAAPGAIVNAFAGFPIGTSVELDTDKMVGDGIYMTGTSGSRIVDMVQIKQKLEAGIIDTNVSLWAVSGIAGVSEALSMVENRTSGGKIMVYPQLGELGVVKLSEMAEALPEVAAEMVDGNWTRAAEKMLLQVAR